MNIKPLIGVSLLIDTISAADPDPYGSVSFRHPGSVWEKIGQIMKNLHKKYTHKLIKISYLKKNDFKLLYNALK